MLLGVDKAGVVEQKGDGLRISGGLSHSDVLVKWWLESVFTGTDLSYDNR